MRFNHGYRIIGGVAILAGLMASAGQVHAQAADIELGRAIAEEHCAACHAIGPDGESAMPEAPPFRELHLDYPVDHLAEALAEGIMVGHPDMPVFVFDPHQIEGFIAYLRTLE